MAEAFGVDGRKFACAICGVAKQCRPKSDWARWECRIHGSAWPPGARYCDAQATEQAGK